jgi:hypothetical protein
VLGADQGVGGTYAGDVGIAQQTAKSFDAVGPQILVVGEEVLPKTGLADDDAECTRALAEGMGFILAEFTEGLGRDDRRQAIDVERLGHCVEFRQ